MPRQLLGCALLTLAVLAVLAAAPALGDASHRARLQEAEALRADGDHEGAVALWRPLSDAGSSVAAWRLGQAHRWGRGVPIDLHEARHQLRLAAEGGHADAQMELAALLYDAPEAGAEQRLEAARLWEASARQGHAVAQYRLGRLYWEGDGVEPDPVRAYAWVSLASAQGLEAAQDEEMGLRRHLAIRQIADARRLAATLVAPRRGVARSPSRERPRAERTEVAAPRAPRPDVAAPPPRRAQALRGPAPEPAPRAEVAPPPPPVAPSEAVGGPGWQVQLGAFADRERAERFLAALEERDGDMLGGRAPNLTRFDTGARGTVHRVRVGSYASRGAARQACAEFESAGRDCVVVRP